MNDEQLELADKIVCRFRIRIDRVATLFGRIFQEDLGDFRMEDFDCF